MQPCSCGSGEGAQSWGRHSSLVNLGAQWLERGQCFSPSPSPGTKFRSQCVHNVEPWLGQSCQRGAFCVNWLSAEKDRESYLE